MATVENEATDAGARPARPLPGEPPCWHCYGSDSRVTSHSRRSGRDSASPPGRALRPAHATPGLAAARVWSVWVSSSYLAPPVLMNVGPNPLAEGFQWVRRVVVLLVRRR